MSAAAAAAAAASDLARFALASPDKVAAVVPPLPPDLVELLLVQSFQMLPGLSHEAVEGSVVLARLWCLCRGA